MVMNRSWILVGILALAFIFCCLSVILIAGGLVLYNRTSSVDISPVVITVAMPPPATATDVKKTPVDTATATPIATPTPPAVGNDKPLPVEKTSSPVTSDTLKSLTNTFVPVNDLLDLVARLNGKTGIARTVTPPAQDYQLGETRLFWATNVDTNENFQVNARLESITEHAYFWIQDGVEFDKQDLQDLALNFENQIYPLNRAFFGSEWSPGVDGDPRLYILYARDLGFNLAGYFSSSDEYPPEAHEYSNAVELFLMNADTIALGEVYTYGVLAHEFQHMIHWNQDRNENSWLNEGFSELAALLNGYYESGFDWAYIQDPDLQLNYWPDDSGATTPHYGAGFLFLTYFLDRFGEEATKAVVSHAENGLTSIDRALETLRGKDPLNNQPVQADDVFIDWAVTNYVLDSSIADGRFNYYAYTAPSAAADTESFSNCPISPQQRTVSQYGVDYIRFECQGSYTIHFEGASQVGVLPVNAFSSAMMFWSNTGDESDMTLTRTFDFTNQNGPLTLSYWTWYDLEEDYDYLYVEASTDGKSWEILNTPSGTDIDPTGNNFGWGYNGISGPMAQPAWIYEEVDISLYAGQKVQLRFEYVTDAAVNGEGFALDDVAVPEIGYFSDFEQDDGGWQASGWVRIDNVLPQTFRLALISFGTQTEVQNLSVGLAGIVDIPIQIDSRQDAVVLVVTGTTRFTRQKAQYQFEVKP